LLAYPHLTPKLDPAGVVEYLAFGHTAGERTLVEGVNKLPPGHTLRVREGRAEVSEYWAPLRSDQVPPDGGLEAQLGGRPGDGGDELLGGYSRWMTYLRFHDRAWRPTPPPVRRLVGRTAKPFVHGLAGDIARRARDSGELFVGSRPFHDDDLAGCLGPIGR